MAAELSVFHVTELAARWRNSELNDEWKMRPRVESRVTRAMIELDCHEMPGSGLDGYDVIRCRSERSWSCESDSGHFAGAIRMRN